MAHAPGGFSNSSAMLEHLTQMQSAGYLVGLASMFVRVVVYCAVFRFVLHPEQSRYAYLRIGAAELFLFLLAFAAYIGFLVAVILPAIVIGIVVAALAMAHAAAAAVIVGVLAVIALIVALAYIGLRFSLVGPMMVDDGKFHLFESWTLTRRHAGALFIVGLCLAAILVVGWTVIGLLMMLSGFGVLSSAAGGPHQISAFLQQPFSAILNAMIPFLAIVAIIWVPLTGCVFAISGAPWAKVDRELSGPDLAATFS